VFRNVLCWSAAELSAASALPGHLLKRGGGSSSESSREVRISDTRATCHGAPPPTEVCAQVSLLVGRATGGVGGSCCSDAMGRACRTRML
jgi:hypothetical protein